MRYSHACRSGNTACVRELIDGNANVFADRKDNGATGLHLACMSGNREIVKMLVEKGCMDLIFKQDNALGDTALGSATMGNQIEIFEFSIEFR